MLKKITKWETEDGKVFDTQEEAEDYMFEQEKEVMTHTTEQPEVEKLRAELAEETEAADNWRRLALQFENHRMQAIGHLKAMLTDPKGSEANALEFIKAAPLNGEAVLAQRIAALAAASHPPEAPTVKLPSESAGWFKWDKISQYWHPQYSEYAETYAKVRGWQKLYTEQQVIDLLKAAGVTVKL